MAPDDRAIEFGCGTGYMITLPMTTAGYDVMGVDTDQPSIAHGRELMERAGADPQRLVAGDLADIDGPFDAVIASGREPRDPGEHAPAARRRALAARERALAGGVGSVLDQVSDVCCDG